MKQVLLHQFYVEKYQKYKSQEKDRRLMRKLIRTINSVQRCPRCNKLVFKTKKDIKEHNWQYHSY